jgi:hypothetical protein
VNSKPSSSLLVIDDDELGGDFSDRCVAVITPLESDPLKDLILQVRAVNLAIRQ